MQPIEHYEVPHLALWKSAVTEILAKQTGGHKKNALCINLDHPMIRATDRYCKSMEANEPPKAPVSEAAGGEETETYLSFLHHRMAHAKIADDKISEEQLRKEIAEYKFGNPLWQQMFIEYYKYYWQYPYHKGAVPQYRSWQSDKYGKGDINYGVIEWKLPAHARIAIVGDIGTGTEEAAAVIAAACKFKPHAFLHLGDVYFSGTKSETRNRFVNMIRSTLKKEKWEVPFFTVPGNHEYFVGAGPFLSALDSGKLVYAQDQKQSASYFCLRTEDNGWQFLGLDTGYNGHYMDVAHGAKQATRDFLHLGEVVKPKPKKDPHWPENNPYLLDPSLADLPVEDTTAPGAMVTIRPDEAEWHQDKLKNFSGRSILLSHHQLYSALNTCGIAQKKSADGNSTDPADPNRTWVNTGLWQQFGPWFEDKIAAWLWGHEHNLVIFEDNYRPADWPTDAAFMQTYKNLPKGRCCGHSAIPVQDTEQPYKINYPVPFKQDDLKLGLTKVGDEQWYNHGFELLELNGAGNPARITYFEVHLTDAIPLPIYTETIQ